jgi:hypothetical protein
MGLPSDDVDYVDFTVFHDWIMDPRSIGDIEWFESRLRVYVDSNCPFQARRTKVLDDGDDWHDHFLSDEESKAVLAKYLQLLTEARNGNVTEESARFLYDHDHFGW